VKQNTAALIYYVIYRRQLPCHVGTTKRERQCGSDDDRDVNSSPTFGVTKTVEYPGFTLRYKLKTRF